MTRRILTPLLCLAGAFATGCSSAPDVSPHGQELFAPTELHIQPVFTKVIDWTGDNKADGVEVLVELRDQFGDTTKGAGTFVFELFSYQPNAADPRGPRVVNPWQAPVDTVETQKQRWGRTTRCYAFRLSFPNPSERANYVLSATFAPVGGTRLFDQIVLAPMNASDDKSK
ncbi:MAG: hypothetical protein QM770_05755 [Tepidisphaeraceae bacterium]